MSASFEEWARGVLMQLSGDVAALRAQHGEHLLSHQRDVERRRYSWQLRLPSVLSFLSLIVATYAIFGR
jgi:hypothetical protein